jgi:hypothetical protein
VAEELGEEPSIAILEEVIADERVEDRPWVIEWDITSPRPRRSSL